MTLTSKIPHDHARYIGQWAMGLNHQLGKITRWDGDKYEGHTLTGAPWWTRMPSVVVASDQQILEEAHETRRRSGG